MATFGLVHGAGHGAWCWERLIPALETRGHRAVAVDLPCDDPRAGALRYAEVVDAALPPVPDLVLVGHSLAGLTVPLVAARRAVARLVFLCAVVPVFGQSLDEQVAADPSMYDPVLRAHPGRLVDAEGTMWMGDEAAARDIYYQDCAPEVARRAFARLRRQAVAPRREACPLTAWPAVERAYILCREDRAIRPDWSRRAARARLGVEPIEMDGGHSPFLSRPDDLASRLAALAAPSPPSGARGAC